jgi:hypothetical protein
VLIGVYLRTFFFRFIILVVCGSMSIDQKVPNQWQGCRQQAARNKKNAKQPYTFFAICVLISRGVIQKTCAGGGCMIVPMIMLCLLSSCVSNWVELAGQALDGTAFTEKTIAQYQNESGFELRRIQNRAGQASLVITTTDFPGVQIRTSDPDASGQFSLSSLSFICASTSGWNEFTEDISGTGVFKDGVVAMVRLTSPVEPVQISAGKILHNNNRLIGEDAVKSLTNRYDRVIALTTWMKEQSDIPLFKNQQEFEAYWKAMLLPELVSAKKRPLLWSEENAVWERTEDISWNTSYTEVLLPEDLRVLRNSGALLRDWEEALSWIYLQYRWHDLIETISKEYNLTKIQ